MKNIRFKKILSYSWPIGYRGVRVIDLVKNKKSFCSLSEMYCSAGFIGENNPCGEASAIMCNLNFVSGAGICYSLEKERCAKRI